MPKTPTLEYDQKIPELEGRDARVAPTTHLERVADGSVAEVPGRRASAMLLVNALRASVDEWRNEGYSGVSATTRELFRWWFEECSIDDPAGFAPYWGQREALETLVYLVEVKRMTDVKDLIEEYARTDHGRLLAEIKFQTTTDGIRQLVLPDGMQDDLPPQDLPRFACKMATGSGKTLVMALAIVWSYFHARREVGSPLATNFLVLAPNVIVYERLRVDFENARIFRELPLIPRGWSFDLKVFLRGEASEPHASGNLFVTNIDQLHERDSVFTPRNAIERLLGRKPSGNAATGGRRMLDRLRDLDQLIVFNDEAHHVHDDELAWNQTLLQLDKRLPNGLALWLDFSATPKDQAGRYFPWIVCDYPLAQAVEDYIVKVPTILHLVDEDTPDNVTNANALEKYGDWIHAGVERLKAHEKAFKVIEGAKPVMFLMCESVAQADAIGDFLRNGSSGFGFKPDQVLVIHTDRLGDVKKSEIDELRRMARDIDRPDSPIRVVVSVLVLREGWDVRSVTLVLGLRPGTAKAQILPEQAVGRGLRLMAQLGPDRRQVLEVMGTPAFESFIKALEAEGVHIGVTKKKPKLPITVQPVKERRRYDISIPKTTSILRRFYKRLEDWDPSAAPACMNLDDIARMRAMRLTVTDGVYEQRLGDIVVDRRRPLLSGEIVAMIVNKAQRLAQLTGEFADLLPLVTRYIAQSAFGEGIDLDAENVRMFLGQPMTMDKVAQFLAKQFAELTTEQIPLSVERQPLALSKTKPFLWRRDHSSCEKTIFNVVATFNPFETQFAKFLNDRKDVLRFAALAEHFTGFWVDYLKPSGALGRYFPDWVLVQRTSDGDVNWIVETKGRVWDGTEQKDAAIRHWCQQVTEQTGEPWKYVRVDQPIFRPDALGSFADLIDLIEERQDALTEQVLFEPLT
jgi:type III restriction enzyme